MSEDRIPPTPRTLSDYNPRENSFDTIRLIAAVLVILSHAFPLTGTAEPLDTLSGGQASIGHLSVSIFFLISGYLIPASLDRGTLSRFASKRASASCPGWPRRCCSAPLCWGRWRQVWPCGTIWLTR